MPEVPELFEIEPADLKVFTIPFFEGYALQTWKKRNAGSRRLRNAKTLRKVEYDWKTNSKRLQISRQER